MSDAPMPIVYEALVEASRAAAQKLVVPPSFRLPPERVTAAAICVDGEVWTLPPPARHCHLIRAYADAHFGQTVHVRIDEQGFVTNRGRYLSRAEAKEVAIAAGQIAGLGGVLTSEDLW